METQVPGFSFQGNELIIVTETKSYRIRGWPKPSALKLSGDGTWIEFRPEFRFVKPRIFHSASVDESSTQTATDCGHELQELEDVSDEKRSAFEAFRLQLPEPVVKAIEGFQSHQWNLIDLLSKEGAAYDLVDNNPVLAWCLANIDQFRRLYWAPSPAEHARPHIRRKQAEILHWLGFPPSDSIVRLMRKIPPEAITPLDARMLRQAITEPEAARFLAHLRPINAGVLGLVCNLKLLPAVTTRLLREVAETDEERVRQPTADLLIDALYLMMVGRIRFSVPVFYSIRAVREFHDLVVAELQRKAEEAREKAREKSKRKRLRTPSSFPHPPVPGTPDIVPLTTKAQLKAEGLEQKNCVGSYARKVRNGGTYIYKVLNPERATLAITLGPDGFWRRSEIELAGNKPVAWSTKAAVDRWLNLHSLSVY